MIYFQKSNSPECQELLDEARNSDREPVYRGGPVYERVKSDFHEKCYLCEDDTPTSIQMEHFEPHKNDLEKKYDWNNLFYSCGHCNNLKGTRWPLLNCTLKSDAVWGTIEIRFKAFPKATVEIIEHPCPGKKEACENTCSLLRSTLAGEKTTPMKMDEAANLRKKMLREHNSLAEAIVNENMEAVREAVSDKAPFAGMQLWTLRNEYPKLYEIISGDG